jgi:hypothetical protein
MRNAFPFIQFHMRLVCFLFTSILLAFSVSAFAQDPTKAAPDSYKLQFENDWVTVLRVHYGARQTVPVHDHSRFPAAYVYLNDSGPINFKHTDWEHPILTRPATKAGSFRLSPTRFDDETHSVENPNDTASEFLRIELKTEAPARRTLQGRFAPVEYPRDKGLKKEEFDNSQLRATRLAPAAGQTLTVTADAANPVLLAILKPGRSGQSTVETGQTIWLAPGEKRTFESTAADAQPIELIRFDLKTKPLQRRSSGGTAK